jgi:hypothetical protein
VARLPSSEDVQSKALDDRNRDCIGERFDVDPRLSSTNLQSGGEDPAKIDSDMTTEEAYRRV